MHDHEKSDECVVPEKQPNNGRAMARSAEVVEGRRSTEGTSTAVPKARPLCRTCLATWPQSGARSRWSTQRFDAITQGRSPVR